LLYTITQAVEFKDKGRPTLVPADAAPCGFNKVVSPAKGSAFQMCFVSEGGAARLNLTNGADASHCAIGRPSRDCGPANVATIAHFFTSM